MKSRSSWKIYRTKFLITAKRLTSRCEVVDSLGRRMIGEPGDYLVAGTDGGQRIARKEIFEDLYVEMEYQGAHRRSAENLLRSAS
jgi:hypothetical protein